jgi:hypothetical protein
VSIKPIDQPLPGEQVVALSPESAAEAAVVWLARPNLFPGRALTAPTLQRRQRWQAGRLALRGQTLTAGIVHGLEVGHELLPPSGEGQPPGVRLTIGAGLGLAVSGEDVVLPQPVALDLRQLPVFAEPSVEVGLPGEEAPQPTLPPPPPDPIPPADGGGDDVPGDDGAGLHARAFLRRRLGALFAAAPDAIARVGVLVLQPIEVDRLGEFDPTDPCELCPCGEPGDDTSFEDWRLADGARLAWYAWPREWRPLPADGPTLRNQLAWTIFDAEAGLAPGDVLPWEQLGVPVALIALDAQLRPLFVDHASVVRHGGHGRDPRLVVGETQMSAQWRCAPLWQARIEQMAEQIADAGDPPPPAAVLAQSLARLPPAGLLPTNALDLKVLPLNKATERLNSDFFPGSFELDAVPVPIEGLDLAVREAAALAPIDMAVPDRVRVLVPVPQAVYEPRLLYEEVIDSEFQATLDRFLLARARALGARQGLRAKLSELVRVATGRAVPVAPPEQDAQALEAENLALWGPPPGGGGHRGLLAAGPHQHFFSSATSRISVSPGQKLYAWAYLDPDNPPRVLMLQWYSGGSWEHRAYWAATGDGALIPWGTDGTVSRARMGDLPAAGRWLRLEVPVAAIGLTRAIVTGMAFTLYDGQAAFGAAGRLTAAGVETPWFSDALPAGAVMPAPGPGTDPWTFLTPNDLNAPFEPVFGFEVDTPANTSLGRYAAIPQLMADPALAELVTTAGQVTGGVLSAAERSQLSARGLDGFIAFLKARADRADNLIDYGFIKVQTDTYRVRQLILGTTAATRLAVSPALATIAEAETAVASQERIASFFGELKGTTAPQALAAGSEPGGGGAAPVTGSTKPAGTISTLAGSRVVLPGIGDVTFPAAQKVSRIVQQEAEPIERFLLQPKTLGYTPIDVTDADPLVGKANIRTTSIAQRLEAPKALEAKDYTTSTRHDAVRALLQFANQLRTEDSGVVPGLFAGINVYGLANDPFLQTPDEKTQRFVPLATFIATPSRLADLLNVPDREGDEAVHFSDSADLSDNTIALVRQVEGRVKLYRNAIAACQRVRDALGGDITGAQASLAAWDDRLAEARQDVAVTRALIAEENDRLGAINARRTAVLQQDVRFLAYIRPRETGNLLTPPAHRLDPGLLEAPVPACLAQHSDVPDELSAMLAVMREAPAAWFAKVPKLIDLLDRVDLLVRTVQTAQLRSQIFALRPQPAPAAATAAPIARAIAAVQVRQRQAVLASRQLAATVNVAQFATLNWRGARDQAQAVVSLGDLIDGEHGRGEVARRAAEAYDQMARVTACLHAEFSAVLPSIRLEWAERLSQFDAAPRLRDLSVLPRWPQVEYIDRRKMQAFVDWLFDQVDAREPRAQDLMNDVVRMCLLLAADAPIGRIIAGRLPRPTVARPGVRIPLTAFDTGRLRVGMQALVYSGPQVLVRAVVEDIGSEISARVIQTATTEVNLGVDARVQFAETAQVSLARPPATRLPARAKTF